jgi:glycosyltransferase involved in cell wall biosynthesis
MHHPLMSIIICNYNYGLFLNKAIDSAINQTYPNIEVIVVDDGSTDNSPEIINSYGDKVVAILKKNGGQASAFNQGFLTSSGEIICLLDSDDSFELHKVSEVVNTFNTHADVGWCFHSIKKVEVGSNKLLEVSSANCPSSPIDLCKAIVERGEKPPFAPPTSGLCFRRAVLGRVLPMPEAESVELNDNYIKFAVTSFSKGFYLNQELSTMGIHGNNLYTDRNDKKILQSRVDMLTAYWLKKNFPLLAKFTNRLFRTGLANYWRCKQIDNKCEVTIKNYLSMTPILEKTEIMLVALLHYSNLSSRIRHLQSALH